ncbi:sensor histidine kinase [Mucilaginibacter myungsuensis]|uniref:Histidine kinase n=1 Tax=Mucilaginibacter myungsuensis TaxID=649104 RepID=A0A929L1V8_9SPHI|nr:histidine kinase [Mucilaginibacter myungsuensis]MBE9662565.1 histidine kinase [Mucilaginibacter myungsuensis]MDN3597985.1 histidine kinase [Mucilaginibacter myungsuensis]
MSTPTSTSSLKLDWAFAGCGLAWALLLTYIIHNFGFDWYTSIADGLVSTFLLAAACWLINNNLRYYQPGKGSYINLLIWCVSLAALVMAGSRWLLPFFNSNVAFTDFLSRSLIIRFFTNFLAIGWMAMISLVWYATLDHKENEKRKLEAERLARDAELYNLRQQLQPHFLFNSLNSINALIGFRPDEARKMIHQLSDFLRGTLRKDDQQLVTLTEELNHLQLYLDIEKVRFGHRLNTEISCDNQCGKALLPALLLQPIVENAIKFGLYDTTDTVTISIRGEMEDNYLTIMVQNPYDAKTTRPRTGTGFGLRGVQRRLSLLFARNDLVETHGNDDIFTTIIKVPQV